MSTDMLVNASLVPVSEVLSKIIEEIYETIKAAHDVLIEKESFAMLSSYLDRIVPVLEELKNIQSSESLKNVVEILGKEIKVAKQLTQECNKRNRLYLLVNCRKIVKRLQLTTREISRALSLIPLASLDLPLSINEEIGRLCDNMQTVEFQAAAAEEEVLERIESGIQERNADRSYANSLMVLIAQAVGISNDQSALKRELDEFKNEIADAQIRKDQQEAIQMDQIIALLGRADAALSPEEKEKKYYSKRNSLGNQPLEPLQSFYCPITRDVMFEPVETSSGQTFERSAIEKWFADGNTTCPLTMTSLNSKILRPNITLRKSIEEWKDRNAMITIASMKPKLSSGDEQEVLQCLSQLQDLCKERDLHREWVALENYIPILVGFLGGSNRQMRSHALSILCLLAKDSDDNKKRIAEVDNAIDFIVRSLAKHISESKLAVALLLELSKNDMVSNNIGKVQGCILLLVTIKNSDDAQATKDAKEVLENLSFLDQNVVQMAKANYFKPLLQRLSSGSNASKMIMAKALSEMELTDHSKATLFDDGVLEPLLQLIFEGDAEVKQVAVKALQNLSSLPRNGLLMIRKGAVGQLLSLLHYFTSSQTLREQVAATIMNLAMSATSPEAGETPVTLLESDDDIYKLFSLISLTGPDVQRSILRTFHAMCQQPSATDMRAKLRQCSAVHVLVPLCEHNNLDIRANAVKLFFCLTVDSDDGTLSEHVNQKCVETLLMIIKTSGDEEEKTAAMGIISNLPPDHTEITQFLLDAGALPIVIGFLTDGNHNGSSRNQLIENAAGVLCRFTVSSNPEWQRRAASAGIIPVLVHLLSSGTALTKRNAAISLAQLSDSSLGLSRRVEQRRGFLCCSPPPEPGCPVHLGMCTVESSFCLLEANAVEPLVRVLGELDVGASKAALRALSTLIEAERLQDGSKVISEAKGIAAIIKLLTSPSADLQEKALHVLERIFRLEEHKRKYGASAQMPLVDITQRGTSTMKPLAAKILAHLNVLHDQSSYF
ncbi:U-box domain-containing protein 44-like [Magnolia sinica]|uniref:U-box domain-containing protein 44-like n=1 Tax=Magnolia sinica TaxID=86752 RepID=UPI00265AE0CE|nr:U-box domain-containing protein 44-like [Magnolia sinica]XP_058104885.1 U-box domain-containing protein 44-like [Magnolia sinica]